MIHIASALSSDSESFSSTTHVCLICLVFWAYGTGYPRSLRWQSFFKPGTVGSDGCEAPKCRSVIYIGHFEAHILPLLRVAPSQSCASCEPPPPPLPREAEGRIVLPRAAPPGAAEDLESRILRRDAGEFERQASGRAGRPADHLKLFSFYTFFFLLDPEGPLRGPRTESSILAQDERWRRA